MEEYCPAVFLLRNTAANSSATVILELKYFNSRRTEIAPSEEPKFDEFPDIWDAPSATSSPRYWMRKTPQQRPTLCLLPAAAKEEAKAHQKTREKTAKKSTPRKRKVA
jgi:hypothetical protein